jgi:ATP-dependent Clp protease ATP-binding subunit ClpC
MYSKFTDRSRKAMLFARTLAKENGEYQLTMPYVFIGLMEHGGFAINLLKNMSFDPDKLKNLLVVNKTDDFFMQNPSNDPYTEQAIDYAYKEAKTFNSNYIGTEHLLLGLLRVKKHPLNQQVLIPSGITYEKVLEEVKNTQPRRLPSREEIKINFYRGILNRILKTCEENSDKDKALEKIKYITRRAIIDGKKG